MHPKISEAFQRLPASNRGGQLDVIVVYRSHEDADHTQISLDRPSAETKSRRISAFISHNQNAQDRLLSEFRYVAKESRLPAREATGVEPNLDGPAGVLPTASLQVSRRTLNALAQIDEVVAILPNHSVGLIAPYETKQTPVTKRERSQRATWGIRRMGFRQLWAQTGSQGEGTTVAVIDTGVHATHPSLANKVSDFVIVDPLGNEVRSQSPFDAGQHGTHVCGTIVGEPDPNGVIIGGAPGAKLIVAAALMGHATVTTIINAISWAAQQGADIITMSLGLQRYEPKFEDLLSPLLSIHGILPVVAIGNASHGNTSTPGNVHSAFAVGALDGPRVASFSGGASLDFPGTQQPKIVKPDVVAPGANVYSCVPSIAGSPEYAYQSGTSMAAPHVAAAAAVLMSAKPAASSSQIADALRITARHPSGPNYGPTIVGVGAKRAPYRRYNSCETSRGYNAKG